MALRFNGLSASAVERSCRDTITGYIENLPFNGEYTNMALVDMLQSVNGVVIVQLKDSSSRPANITVPLMDGVASAGSSVQYSAVDHVHPHDSTIEKGGNVLAVGKYDSNTDTTTRYRGNYSVRKDGVGQYTIVHFQNREDYITNITISDVQSGFTVAIVDVINGLNGAQVRINGQTANGWSLTDRSFTFEIKTY